MERGPSSPHALFPDLRGVTVRNTFLEFEDVVIDEFSDTGFQRQASEPVKPFHRKVSEQTTTGSEMTLEECNSNSNTEAEENYAQCLYLATTGFNEPLRGPGGSSTNRAPAGILSQNISASSQKLKNGQQTTLAQMNPQVQQPQSNQLTIFRYCPNCGAEVEPSHRFCPYCCFQLQQIQVQSSTTPVMQQGAQMQMSGFAVSSTGLRTGQGGALSTSIQQPKPPAPETPDMLGCIRRFRYIEAVQNDVDRARGLCESLMRGMKVA